jgi:hypothetical protein
MPRKNDPDRADEGTQDAPQEAAVAAPTARETPAASLTRRVKGAQFLGGVWYAADGSPLNDKEAQAAHRAMDREAAEARARVLLGVQE